MIVDARDGRNARHAIAMAIQGTTLIRERTCKQPHHGGVTPGHGDFGV
jgi:hypothetical protein